jgi:membrane protease YdiL (CAAX protease family)
MPRTRLIFPLVPVTPEFPPASKFSSMEETASIDFSITRRIADKRTAPSMQSKRRDLFEIILVYGMVLLVFWTPGPWQLLAGAGAAISIAAIAFTSADSFRSAGLCRKNLSCALWAVGSSLGVAVLAVVAAGRMHTLHLPSSPVQLVWRSSLYFVWACIQQWVLQGFFLSRLLRVLDHSTWAAGAAAVLFAMAHTPSPILMAVTLVCGLAACLFFLRYRSLYPLIAAHMILGTVIAVTIPEPVDHDMYVGLAYLHYAKSMDRSAQPQRPDRIHRGVGES